MQRAQSETENAEEGLTDLLQRERADFLNYKRRIERERGEEIERARGDVIKRLLPLLDELDRAMHRMPEELESNAWAQGVALQRQQFAEALRQLGVEWFGTVGEPFDPASHEALFYEARPDAAAPTVAEVVRPGYRLNGHLVRPALVTVFGPEVGAVEGNSEDGSLTAEGEEGEEGG